MCLSKRNMRVIAAVICLVLAIGLAVTAFFVGSSGSIDSVKTEAACSPGPVCQGDSNCCVFWNKMTKKCEQGVPNKKGTCEPKHYGAAIGLMVSAVLMLLLFFVFLFVPKPKPKMGQEAPMPYPYGADMA